MKNYAIIDYDASRLHLFFKGEEIAFDLTQGDIGEFWHGFETKDGKVYDVNYGEESGEDNPSVCVYGTLEIDGSLAVDTDNCTQMEIIRIGEPTNYFYRNHHDNI